MECNIINIMTDKKLYNYNYILDRLGIGTILRLFQMEDYECNKIVLKCIKSSVKRRFNLLTGDSNGRSYLNYSYETMAEVYSSIDWTVNIIDYCNCSINPDFIILTVLKQKVNHVSTKVIYLKINKRLFPTLIF